MFITHTHRSDTYTVHVSMELTIFETTPETRPRDSTLFHKISLLVPSKGPLVKDFTDFAKQRRVQTHSSILSG